MNSSIEVIFSDKSSKNNADLVKFFKGALPRLVPCGMTIDFQVAKKKDIEYYNARKITTFPTLVYNKINVVGVSKIIAFINGKMIEKKRLESEKSSDNILDDFWRKSIGTPDKNGKFKDDEDESVDGNNEKAIESRRMMMQESMQKRKISSGPESPTTDHPQSHRGRQAAPDENNRRPTPRKTKPRDNNIDDTPTTVDVLMNGRNKTSEEQKDDMLMAKFYANMEETHIV